MNKKDFNKTTIIFFIVAFVLVSLFAAIVLSVSDNDINTSSSNSDGYNFESHEDYLSNPYAESIDSEPENSSWIKFPGMDVIEEGEERFVMYAKINTRNIGESELSTYKCYDYIQIDGDKITLFGIEDDMLLKKIEGIIRKDGSLMETRVYSWYDRNGIQEFLRCKNEYNESGKLLKNTYYRVEGGIHYAIEYQYNEFGNIVKSIDKEPGLDDIIDTYFYDKNNNLIRIENIMADKSIQIIEWSYDENGVLLSKYNSLKEYKETYDAKGNVIGEYQVQQDKTEKLTATNEYDDNDRLVKRTEYGINGPIKYEIWIYDDNGYLLSYSDVWHNFEGKITTYEYDKRGNLIKKELSYTDEDFLREKYLMEYNNLNQLIKQEEYRYNYRTNLLNLEYRYFYEYDKYGNLIKKICYDSNGVERVKDEYKWELVRLPKGFIDFLEMNADKDTIKTPSK